MINLFNKVLESYKRAGSRGIGECKNDPSGWIRPAVNQNNSYIDENFNSMISIHEFESHFQVVLPPLFKAYAEKGELLKSKETTFYSLSDILKSNTTLKKYRDRVGFCIGDWGTGDEYVLLKDSESNEIEEIVYLYQKDLNAFFMFAESIETLLREENDY
jgi:hypothetical protein